MSAFWRADVKWMYSGEHILKQCSENSCCTWGLSLLFLLKFWMNSTSPWTTTFTANNTLSSSVQDGAAASTHTHTHTHTGYCYVIWLCLHPYGSVSARPHQGCGRCRPVAREELWGCWGWLGLLFSAGLWWAPARSLQRILGIEAVAMGWKGRMHSELQQIDKNSKDIQQKSINICFTIFYTTGQFGIIVIFDWKEVCYAHQGCIYMTKIQ